MDVDRSGYAVAIAMNKYLLTALRGFLEDPADTEFQQGYQKALEDFADYMQEIYPV